MVEGRGLYMVVVGKPVGKGRLGRPRRRWVENIKMDFRKWDVLLLTRLSWLSKRTGGGY
jgi:hypothetical protein